MALFNIGNVILCCCLKQMKYSENVITKLENFQGIPIEKWDFLRTNAETDELSFKKSEVFRKCIAVLPQKLFDSQSKCQNKVISWR